MREIVLQTDKEISFLNEFEKFGDKFYGFLLGYEDNHKLSINKQRLFVVEDNDGNIFYVPIHYNLYSKLNIVCNDSANIKIKIEIEYLSLRDFGGGKKMKIFKVLSD